MKKRLATAGLAAFLLADVALVALALRSPETAPAGPSAATSSTPVSAGRTAPTTSGSEQSIYEPAPLTRMVVGLDDRHAWRASAGSCADGGAKVHATRDGGKTWSKGESPTRAIARIQPLEESRGFIYGADEDCSLSEYVTSDAGSTWEEPRSVTGIWSRVPTERNVVATPEDEASRPCGDQAVLDLVRTSATKAQSLCLDGAVKATDDGGATWADAGKVPGGLALTGRGEGGSFSMYAARVSEECAGIEVVRVRERAEPVGCVATTAAAAPGEVSVSTVAKAGWLVVGDETWTSSADLKTWKRA